MVYRRFVQSSRTQPARTIIGVIAIMTIVAGLWIFTPWYVPAVAAGPAFTAAFDVGQTIAAAVNVIACVPALIGLRCGTPRQLARGSWWLFIWYTFVTITRLVTHPVGSLYWLPIAIIAIVLSILYIEQKFLARHDA